jgi:hypothetical protein
MLKPTQDKDLKTRLHQMFKNADKYWEWTDCQRVVEERREIFITEILKEIEQRGYHVGLPSIIEEALNSSDGTYRP